MSACDDGSACDGTLLWWTSNVYLVRATVRESGHVDKHDQKASCMPRIFYFNLFLNDTKILLFMFVLLFLKLHM